MFKYLVLGLALCGLATATLAASELTDLFNGEAPAAAPAANDRVISVESDGADDAQIRDRLVDIYSQIPELDGVAVDVSSGVVVLKGELVTATAETKAVSLAEQVEGVVEVINELAVDRGLRSRLAITVEKIVDLGRTVVASLPLLLLAVAVFFAIVYLGRWLAKQKGLLARISPNPFIASLYGQLLQIAFALAGLATALMLLDATALLGAIMGAAGIIGLAIGFAVRDTVENYIASILLSIRNPFGVNDFVNIEGHEGNVIKLTSRATVLLSPDGNHIRIPNATIFKSVITNFTRKPERRFEFDVGVDTELDLQAAQALALDTLREMSGIQDQPAPTVVVHALGDSNVVLRCFGWVDQTQYSFLKVRSEAIRSVKREFDQAGIVMPEPVYRVRLQNAATAADAVAPSADRHGESARPPNTQPAPGRDETGDLSADRTIEQQVAEEHAADGDNLLDPNVASEL